MTTTPSNTMATKQNIDCPLCKGQTIQPYETVYDHHGQSIGLRSEMKWRLEGTTLYQTVSADYISDHDLYYDEDFTPEVKYCIPVHVSHCPCCQRRLTTTAKKRVAIVQKYEESKKKKKK